MKYIILILILLVGCAAPERIEINCTTLPDVIEDNCTNSTVYVNITHYVNKTEIIYNPTCNSTYTLKMIQQIKRLEYRALRYRNCTEQGYDFDSLNKSLYECLDELCELNRSSCGMGT